MYDKKTGNTVYFTGELEKLAKRHIEKGDVEDRLLAEYILSCLNGVNKLMQKTDEWNNRHRIPEDF